MASRMFSNDGYFPVPTIRRDLNSFPPSQSDVSYMVPCLPYPLLLHGFMYPLGSPSAAPRQATALHILSARLRLRLARPLRSTASRPPLDGRSRPCRRP